MKTTHPSIIRAARNRAPRKGVSLVLAALSLTVLLGVTGFVIDMGNVYLVRAQAQKAADAAALAGALAYTEPGVDSGNITATALARSRTFATVNGFNYQNTASQVTVDSRINPTGTNPGQHRAEVGRRVQYFFMPILGLRGNRVVAAATAQYISPLDLATGSVTDYGKTPGNVNLSVFGPLGRYSFGDAYSARYLDNGTPNTEYSPAGYDFKIKVASTYTDTEMAVQIFDPDTYNVNGNNAGPGQIDEIRSPSNAVRTAAGAAYTTDITTTKYSLYYDDPVSGASTLIATANYGGDSSSDMKWTTPGGFSFNPNSPLYGGPGVAKSFRLNVQSIDGASENGFDLRAGKTGTPDAGFVGNGTGITAAGRIPINFNSGGQVSIKLADIPRPNVPVGTDTKIFISKFDTDVGSTSVRYFCDPPPSNQPAIGYPGVLSSNGRWLTDTVTLPGDYAGGAWRAVYQAGSQDTSVWRLEANFPAGRGGTVNLIR